MVLPNLRYRQRLAKTASTGGLGLILAVSLGAQHPARATSAQAKARQLVARMTLAEKIL